MDIRMSDLDGLEATRRLQRDPATAQIPVIAVTATAFGDTRQAALDAGCVDYLPKPIRAESLFAALQSHLGVRFVTGVEPARHAELELSDPARYLGIARRLREAVTIGDVSDLEGLAAGARRRRRRRGRARPAHRAPGHKFRFRWARGSGDAAGESVRGRGGGPCRQLRTEAVVAAPPPSTILVVDDSPVNLQVLVRTLNGTGHRILAAKNGRTALEIARRARPDLMLLDVMMPDINGFEVCRAIKADAETQDMVVIFLSALGEVADKVSGLKLGAVDYITKPIQAEEVLARVANHLTRQSLERELRRSRDRLDRELASAAQMQRLLLPRAMPVHPSVSFAAYYQTSRHAGGDYYDVVELGADRFGVLVADVSGHGAPAAIVMAMIRTAFHTHPEVAARSAGGPAQHQPALPVPLGVGDVRHGGLRRRRRRHVARSGSRARDIRRRWRSGRATACSPLSVESVLPLLWMELGDVPCAEHALRPGDRVVFYTDGITDRLAADETMYDQERLMSALATFGSLPPAAIVEHLVADLDAFAGGHEPDDDQTLLVVGVDGDATLPGHHEDTK